jgi:large subunit ribosomal protein L25
VKGKKSTENVMIKDYQLEPVEHRLLHADLIRVAMDQVLTVAVPVELTGTAVGVKQDGGMLDFVTRSVEVSCLPGDIPETIVYDVSDLEIGKHGKHVRAADLELPQKLTLESDPGLVIAHVIAPKGEVEEEAEAEAAAAAASEEESAEPEVIKKGKAEEGQESKTE